MPRSIPPQTWEIYDKARRRGLDISASSRIAGISRTAAYAYEKGLPTSSGVQVKKIRDGEVLSDVIPLDELKPEAARALTDFEYFRLRYLGRRSLPWQVAAAADAAGTIEHNKATSEKSYKVVNVAPGAGKSTLFTCDIPLWLACRDRSIRIMIGSAVETTAKFYTRRIKNHLERTSPYRASSEDVAKGLACDAEACLTQDYGRFKPRNQDLWRVNEFVIAQHGDVAAEDKEPSFVAYGADSGYLGNRFDFIIWDDLVNNNNQRTVESRENQRKNFDGEAEKRLEPGGLFILQGQRIAADDLYRYCLDKVVDVDDEDEEDGPPNLPMRDGQYRKYEHIIYKAHYEELCRKEFHRKDAPAYNPFDPESGGCLLDPFRLSWKDLRAEMKDTATFRVIYQQEDVDPKRVLVQKLWVSGGTDADGHMYPGCWDSERRAGIVPKNLTGDQVSVVSCDPSPTNYWAVEWWIYHPDSEFRYLIDLERRKMDAPDLLDWNQQEQKFTGLLEDWWQRANEQGHPFKTLIVEHNAAQRFLLQYDHCTRWKALHGVDIIAHTTHGQNKADPTMGVTTIAPHWMYGRVRLPGYQHDTSRLVVKHLVDEVTRWPEGRTDDCVMAEWFFELKLPTIYVPSTMESPAREMPSWMSRRAS